MALSCVLFFMGTRLYVCVRPEGSPFTYFAQGSRSKVAAWVNMVALTAWLPAYDLLVVPALWRVMGREEGISQLQRIGIGLELSVVTMAVAVAVEHRQRWAGARSSWAWMVPQ
uniref:Uncharacterized protein n=1 Tax=Oryza nivara TaxID=4536 RepID=A0A0E0J9C0_ORYNI